MVFRSKQTVLAELLVATVAGMPVGGRHPGGIGTKRRVGGQTAEQSMTSSREVGRPWCVTRLRSGMEHGASVRVQAAFWWWAVFTHTQEFEF